MAFGNLTALYFPTAANAGASQWGSDVRKLLDSADAADDATSTLVHATNSTTTITLDPFSASSTNQTEANYGFAVTPSDMNSLAGAQRFFAAGTHTLTCRMKTSNALGQSMTAALFVYRVGPAAGRTRTLLGSNTATFSLATLSAYGTFTIGVTLGEIIFAADETVQYSFEDTTTAPITGAVTNTFDTGTQGGVAIRVDTPYLGVLAPTDGACTGDAAVAGDMGKVLGTVSTLTGDAAVAGVTGSTFSADGTITGDAAVAGATSSVFSTAGAITGDATIAGSMSSVLGSVFTIDTGGTAGAAGYSRARVVNQ